MISVGWRNNKIIIVLILYHFFCFMVKVLLPYIVAGVAWSDQVDASKYLSTLSYILSDCSLGQQNDWLCFYSYVVPIIVSVLIVIAGVFLVFFKMSVKFLMFLLFIYVVNWLFMVAVSGSVGFISIDGVFVFIVHLIFLKEIIRINKSMGSDSIEK